MILIFLQLFYRNNEDRYYSQTRFKVLFLKNLNPKINDEELFQLLKENNSDALKILFSRFYENLCYFAFGYLKDQQISDEIVSDMFLNIWEKRKHLIITGKVKPYLYTAVKNRALNYLRNNRIHFEKLDSVDQITLTMLSKPDDKINYDELKNVIDGLIDSLPEKRKLIFQMSRFDELTYKEIADILSISESTVKNQMVKAVKYINAQYPVLKRIFPK